MGYSVKGGKLHSRKLARSLKQSIKFTQSLPAEVQERMEAEGRELGPKELAKKLARKYLASEVSEKIMHDLPDMRATYQGDVPEDMIVELLEQLVEGDLVIDNASVHQWFKKKLDDYRDFCIKIDEDQTVEAIQAGFFLASLDHFDILIQREHGVSPTHAILTANAKARDLLADMELSDDIAWNKDGFENAPVELIKDFQVGGIVLTTPTQPSWDPILKFAQCLIEHGLKVAFVDKWGGVSEAELSGEAWRTEDYHGMKIPYNSNGLLDWKGDQAAYDRYIDLKVEHDGIMALTDYQLGNYFDRHPDIAPATAAANKKAAA